MLNENFNNGIMDLLEEYYLKMETIISSDDVCNKDLKDLFCVVEFKLMIKI